MAHNNHYESSADVGDADTDDEPRQAGEHSGDKDRWRQNRLPSGDAHDCGDDQCGVGTECDR